ncbi:hypothetical protein TEA_001841 [Camellia sinensis var. sinensis]|uniref:Uncharacterized protein n=1 Tax=Camellia sinensis var. sinensis TaxID=542762 RepID=A0A4S4DSN8_CAMSN|nr:hypothetical protein TEA_001841 [Camellia sinensis var. sinensis]
MDFVPLLQAAGILVALLVLSKIWMSKTGTQAPEPKGAWPIIGHLHLLAGQTPLFRTLAAMADRHGPIFTIRLGFRRAIVVSSKETITECFSVNDRAFMSRPQTAALKYMGYNGAGSALGPSDDYWRELRKVTTQHLLTNRHLESLKHVRALEVDLSIKELHLLSIKNECKVKVSEWFRQVTLNLMLRVIAGKRYNCGDNERDKEARQFARTMDEFMYLAGVSECSDVIPGIEWLDLQGNVKAMKRNGYGSWCVSANVVFRSGRFDGGSFNCVLRLRVFGNGSLSVWASGCFDFGSKLQPWVCLYEWCSAIESVKFGGRGQTLILGGSDTTTATLTWAISLLLNHPTALKTVQQEIDMYIGHGKLRRVDESDTKNLVYLQAIIKETLRLYPSGPLSIPRESIQDCHVSGYYVPKGTRLIVNIWKLHRDPRLWADPNEFRPERFLTSQAEVDLRGRQFELLPFSAGRRSCPGSTLAYQMLHLILARLLQGFNLAILPGNGKVDMSEGLGLSLPKATPLEVLVTPRLPSGSDTTTATLTWAISLLLNHPTALKTVQQEIDMYIGHGKLRRVDESDTKNLVYLQAIVKETLRLYPPGPLSIPRESVQDCHVSGYYVPKGTRLIVNIWKLHRDPCLSTEPDEFRPKRFLTWQAKSNLKGQQFELLPFGAGRRSCPGNTLTYQMLHLILARLLQGFNLAILPGNEEVDMSEGLGLSLPKATPLEVLVTPRLPSEFYDQP